MNYQKILKVFVSVMFSTLLLTKSSFAWDVNIAILPSEDYVDASQALLGADVDLGLDFWLINLGHTFKRAEELAQSLGLDVSFKATYFNANTQNLYWKNTAKNNDFSTRIRQFKKFMVDHHTARDGAQFVLGIDVKPKLLSLIHI